MLIPLFLFVGVAHTRGQQFIPCAPYGGLPEAKLFMAQEMRFPESALEAGVNGATVLIFTVKSTGELQDLRIWRALDPACDAEAIRLGRLIRWHPATLGDVPRDAEHYLEVPFHAKRYRRMKEKQQACPASEFTPSCGPVIFSTTELDTLARPGVPGGLRGLSAYMSSNMRYPEDARRRDIQGPVQLQFVIEESGTISNLYATRDLGGGCAGEAMRLVRSICWEPAVKNGSAVRSAITVDILFKLPDP